MIAIPWYFTMQDDMELFGIIYVLTNCVSFFWVPYSGTFIDRFNRKHIFLAVTTVCGLILMGIALLGFYWGALPWYMVALVFMMTFFNYNIHYPNLYAFVQEISEKDYYGKITSYIEIQGQLSSILAGAGAAILLEGTRSGKINLFGFKVDAPFSIDAWQIHEIFMMDAVTYLFAFLFIFLIRYQPLAKRKEETGNVWAQLKIGYSYLKDNSTIFLFGVASYSIFVCVLVTTFFIAATYVKKHLGENADVFAASEMYYAMGAVLAGIGVNWVFKKMTIPFSVILMTILTAILFAVLAITQNTVVFYLMLLILGLTNAGTRILRVTFLFSHVPNQVYGRATSIFFLTNIAFRTSFLALFSIPFFQSSNNIIYAFGILSVFLTLAAIVLIRFYPAVIALDEPKGRGL